MSVTGASEPVRVLRPNPRATVLELVSKALFHIVPFAVFVAVFAALFSPGLALVTGVGVLLLGLLLAVWWARRYARTTEYRLYEDHIECEVGGFGTDITSVDFDTVRSVSRRQSFVEARYGLGNVRVSTTGGETVRLRDIPDHERWYEFIHERT